MVDCARHTHGGCRVHYPLGIVEVRAPLLSDIGTFDVREAFIAHADPVVALTPALLDEAFVTLEANAYGASATVVDRRYELVGYCEVAEAIVGVIPW